MNKSDKERYYGPLDSDDQNDEKPIYNLEDDIEDGDEGASEDPEESGSNHTPYPFTVLFRTMLTPVEGWKMLKRARFSNEKFAVRCFIPSIVLAGMAEGMKMFYEANYSAGDWMLDAIIMFITFFFSYFTVLLLASYVLPKKSRGLLTTAFGHQFVLLCLSTLAIFWAILLVIPMLDPVLVFLPIWTIYLIYKGSKILRVQDEVKSSTVGILCCLIVGAPLLWNWIMTEWIINP